MTLAFPALAPPHRPLAHAAHAKGVLAIESVGAGSPNRRSPTRRRAARRRRPRRVDCRACASEGTLYRIGSGSPVQTRASRRAAADIDAEERPASTPASPRRRREPPRTSTAHARPGSRRPATRVSDLAELGRETALFKADGRKLKESGHWQPRARPMARPAAALSSHGQHAAQPALPGRRLRSPRPWDAALRLEEGAGEPHCTSPLAGLIGNGAGGPPRATYEPRSSSSLRGCRDRRNAARTPRGAARAARARTRAKRSPRR